MMLKNKTILILSPQAWGKMFLSKHHYALELAKRGNKVFFLNPPDQTKAGFGARIDILKTETPGLLLINHQLFFPYWFKFKALPVFHWLMKFHINRILRRIDPVDIVWSFDLGHLYPLKFFNATCRIFHPVDEPLNEAAIRSAEGSQIIFSVTPEILQKYGHLAVTKYIINHGVSSEFIIDRVQYEPHVPVQVGISGNLLRPEIDHKILLQIISENPAVIFNFWGSYSTKDSNIGGTGDSSVKLFLDKLQGYKNVILHGTVHPSVLAIAIREMDMFLICYDVQRDQSKGTNYHKIMEYLGMGKVIVSNNITTYAKRPDLVQMVEERDTNERLPQLFGKIIHSLNHFNSKELMSQRIDFARKNTYAAQLDKIESLL